jgi:hypothetical protein
MEEIKLVIGGNYSPKEYAELIGVEPSRITQLKKKLVTVSFSRKWFVKHCEENLKLFENPSHNAKRK